MPIYATLQITYLTLGIPREAPGMPPESKVGWEDVLKKKKNAKRPIHKDLQIVYAVFLPQKNKM